MGKKTLTLLLVLILFLTLIPISVDAAWIDETSSNIDDGDTDVPLTTYFSIQGYADMGSASWNCSLYDDSMNFMTGWETSGIGYSPYDINLPGIPLVTTLEVLGCTEYTWYYIIVYVEDDASSDTYSIHFETGAGGGGALDVTTNPATNVASFSAVLNGEMSFVDGTSYYCYFDYGETIAYGELLYAGYLPDGSSFNANTSATGLLTPNTEYHFRAWVTDWATIYEYGDDMTFNTGPYPPDDPPIVTTLGLATGITQKEATIRGFLSYDGNLSGDTLCTVRFQYGKTIIYDSNTTNQMIFDGNNFQAIITGLEPETLYHYRAYANNSDGEDWGTDETFTTLPYPPPDNPIVETNAATDIGTTTAKLWGMLLEGSDVINTVRFEYGLNISYGMNTSNQFITVEPQYIYAGGGMGSNNSPRLLQYYASNLSRTNNPGGPYLYPTSVRGQHINSIVCDGNYIYDGGYTNQYAPYPNTHTTVVYKYDPNLNIGPTNWSYYAASQLYGTQYQARIWSIAQDDDYIYVGGMDENMGVHSPRVFKYQKDDVGGTMLKVGESTPHWAMHLYAVDVDDIYVYAGGDHYHTVLPGPIEYWGDYVAQYWKNNLTERATTPLFGSDIKAIVNDDTYIYVSGSPLAIDDTYLYAISSVKIYYKTDMSFKQTLTVPAGQTIKQYWLTNLTSKDTTAAYGGTIQDIVLDRRYVYAGGDTVNKVFKYWKTNMTKKIESEFYGYAGPTSFIHAVASTPMYEYPFSQTLTGLTPGTTYHFRAYAENAGGGSTGIDFIFTTLNESLPPIPPVPPAGGTSNTVYGDGNPNLPHIFPPEPPVYPTGFTIPEMYSLLRANLLPNSDTKITVMVLDSGYTSLTYNNVSTSTIIPMKDEAYTSAYDENGHGTWVNYAISYLLQTKLKNSQQISYKVFDDKGGSTNEQFINALNKAKELHPDIVSISAGVKDGTPQDAFSQIVNSLRNEGIIVIVAVGNYGPLSGTLASPACADGAIGIAASDPKVTHMTNPSLRQTEILDLITDAICPWSSRGPVEGITTKPDVTSPGESIRGPWLTGERVVSGTSMATPLVSGGAAVIVANEKGLSDIVKILYFWDKSVVPQTFEDAMKSSCFVKGSVNEWGAGIIQFDKVAGAYHSGLIWRIIIWFIPLIIIILVIIYYHRSHQSRGLPKWVKKL